MKDLSSTCTPLKPDHGLFEICLNYGMLTRVGSTCTISNISMINSSIFLAIMQIGDSTCTPLQIELLIIFIFIGNSNKELSSTCTPLKYCAIQNLSELWNANKGW